MTNPIAKDNLSKYSIQWVTGWALVFLVYVLVAASSYAGYFAKWAFRDGQPRQSLVAALDGSASKPFVYRQLLPTIVISIRTALPAEWVDAQSENWIQYKNIQSIYSRATDAETGRMIFEYRVAYYLVYIFWLMALILLAFVCYEASRDIVASTVAPLVFSQLYPILLTRGGYYYDPVEMLFFALSALLALRQKVFIIVLIAPVAALNKEAFLFWIICLIPLFGHRAISWRVLSGCALAIILSGLTYLAVKAQFSGNPGGSVSHHFYNNLLYYGDLSSYFGFEYSYGLQLPRGVNLINVAALAALLSVAWSGLSGLWRQHILLALLINVPLFLLFAWRDELRNLSLLFVGLVVLIATGIKNGMRSIKS